MVRPLGPADVGACPTLPEAKTLLQELRQAGTARLAGVPGAGKSIFALQTARAIGASGWRTFRLTDPTAGVPPAASFPEPTLYIVDDAHLAPPAQLPERTLPWAAKRGIRIDFLQPGQPQQNAYVERYNRTVRYDWLAHHLFETLDEIQDFATRWLWTYNHDRPNMALGGITPKQKLALAA